MRITPAPRNIEFGPFRPIWMVDDPVAILNRVICRVNGDTDALTLLGRLAGHIQ